MEAPFATGAFSRQYGTLDSRLTNMMAEAATAGPVPDQRLPRPGLVSAYTLGTGPARGAFYNKGIFGGQLVIVSGTTAYTADGTARGAIPGRDLVRFDSSPTQLVGVAAGKVYLSSAGADFAPIVSDVLPPVVDVAYVGGYFVYSVLGSTRFYYSEVNDAPNINGLNFASVETTPDPILGTDVLGDELVFFKESDIEFWSLTGDADNPFQKSPGVRYMRGCASRDTIQRLDNALFWVSENRMVFRSGQVPERVSDHGIEDKLRQCANMAKCTAWTTTFEGHEFYVVNIFGVGSYCYDVSAKDWTVWTSYGQAGFRALVAETIKGVAYLGDLTTNTIWTLAQGAGTDGSDPIVREASAFMPLTSGRPRCNSVTVTCVRGVGLASGYGSDPVVELRYSDDAGKTFSRWRQRSLGKTGQTSRKAVFRKLGLMQSPGRLFQVRCSDPVMSVFQSLVVNEPYA